MHLNSFSSLVLVLILCFLARTTSADSNDSSLQEWKAKSGITIQAKLLKFDETAQTITLERTDGKTVDVPFDKLDEDSLRKARELSVVKTLIGKWYWRCPSKSQPDWRIESVLESSGEKYFLTESSTGHTTEPDSQSTYEYRKQREIYLPVRKPNASENRSPFVIDKAGDRIVYSARIVLKGKVVSEGGEYIDIHYKSKDDAENWIRSEHLFLPIKLK